MEVFGVGLGVGVLVWMAFVFDVFGFLARDELVLRLLMGAAMALYIVYYATVAEDPLWDAMLTNGTLAAVNLVMIFVVIAERTTLFMSREDNAFYAAFRPLSPGQFRRLLRLGRRRSAGPEELLLTEGATTERLYFLSSGAVEVVKGGRAARIESPAFLGEIAFLRHGPATATVRALEGAVLLDLPAAALHRALDRSPAFRNAFVARLTEDLLEKVGRGLPVAGSR